MNRNTVWSFLLAAVPFLAVCVSVPLWDRVYPLVLGLPFNLAWLIAWIPLTSICMTGVYKFWKRRENVSDSPSRAEVSPAGKAPTR
jgi:uncharacterized iron-regulated membrane protein